MVIVFCMVGFFLGEVDLFRCVVSKKKKDIFD